MNIYFYKGNENILENSSNKDGAEADKLKVIKEDLSKVFDTKSLSFLLGSGCSSYYDGKVEVGIPTMKPMAKEFFDPSKGGYSLKKDEIEYIKNDLCINIDDDAFKTNIEKFLETLHSLNFYIGKTELTKKTVTRDKIIVKDRGKLPPIIEKTKHFILEKCLNEKNRGKDENLVLLYETFYRKLLYRNPNLPKPNIFTTNYDLYSEKALDNIGVLYANGFSGGISKYFNPTIFNYAYAERMDLSQNKWNIIDNFIYLYKIHGSVNWIEDDSATNKLFKIKEIQDASFDKLKDEETLMIYPSPTKQNASLGSPYSDLFREFQKKLMQNNNVLITMGYSFSDEHINNLIYQAFTIPSFRLISFIEENDNTKKLIDLNDPRIWIIGGKLEDDNQLHYFKEIVSRLFPDLTNDEIDEKIETIVKKLLS